MTAREIDLDAIEARAKVAAPGPLTMQGEDGDYRVVDRIGREVGSGYDRETARFFAHARADVPALVAEVRRLQARVDELEDDARMACETPASGCDCAGCLYAAEVNALAIGGAL